MNKQKIKKLLKSVLHVNQFKLISDYGEKLGIGFPRSLFKIKLINFDYIKILNIADNKNYSDTCFYYGLDENIVAYSTKSIVGNIPMDYSCILDMGINGIKDQNLRAAIENYIDRTGDLRIKKDPVTNLKDALQMILFWNQLLWQTGHRLNGLGRLDKVLGKYMVPDDAEYLVDEFLKTLHYGYSYKSNSLKGDIGQIIIVGGLEQSGQYFRNSYTDLFLKCIGDLKLPDPKILLRSSVCMPKELLKSSMEVISTGIGCPLLSNDDIIIPLLIDFGYEVQDAYNYGVSACWEPLSIGNSLEQNNLANIQYGKCTYEMLTDKQFVECKTFDDIYFLFLSKLTNHIDSLKNHLNSISFEEDGLISELMNLDRDISQGGAKYNNYGVLSVGMSAAVNSLINIKKMAFDEKKYSLRDIQAVIIENYQSDLEIFSENANGYGVDSIESINITDRIINDTEALFADYRNPLGGKVKFGLSSPNYIDYGKKTGATLDGRKAYQPFETHISRGKGESITELVNFESKLKFTGNSSNGNVIDMMVQRSLLNDNKEKFIQYLYGGLKQGLFQIQFNVLSYAQLIDAKTHPEKYPNLIVRVWGFSAYFNDLPEEYKDNLIRRAKEMEKIA